jgi:pyruvate dehydrogenase E1 component alpha subunit
MESIRVDGNDVMEVLQKTSEIVEKTRGDSQPRFIEALCYRFKGHSVVDPDKYRPSEEKEEALKTDPIVIFERRLAKAGVVAEDDLKRIHADVEKQVQEIIRYADESPNPAPDELYRYLYGGEWETVKNG